MARRRYLSTDISRDARINKLAMQGGDFAALLYTWLIPHVEDDARLKGTAEEVLLMVMPGRRDKQPEDIEAALLAMHELGLIIWVPGGDEMRFPDSFYTYQTYITKDRRSRAQGAADQRRTAPNGDEPRATAQNAADQRGVAQSAADQRGVAQSAASLKVSSSFSSSLKSSPTTPVPPAHVPAKSSSVLVDLIGDELPKIAEDFTKISLLLSSTWLRNALAEAELECDGGAAELTRLDVVDAIDAAWEAIDRAMRVANGAHQINNPEAFARHTVVKAIGVRLNEIREQRRRPTAKAPPRQPQPVKPVTRPPRPGPALPTGGTSARST